MKNRLTTTPAVVALEAALLENVYVPHLSGPDLMHVLNGRKDRFNCLSLYKYEDLTMYILNTSNIDSRVCEIAYF